MLPNPKKVFISSTGHDLADYRSAAIDVCNELGLVPVAMEFFEAMGVGATAGSRSKLDGAGVYVGIVAWRYGYVEPGLSTSVTEAEFDYAGEKAIERLCFVLDSNHPWPVRAVDAQRDAIDAFRAKVGRLIRAQFTTVESFKYELRAALEGWLTRIAAGSSGGESDKARVKLMRKVFDRPAFRVTFVDELQEDLAEAIDNVQTALNTGKLFTRKGVSLGDVPDRHAFDTQHIKDAFERIVKCLTLTKDAYRDFMDYYRRPPEPFPDNWREILYQKAEKIDEIRNQVLREFNALLIEADEMPLPLIIPSSVWIASGTSIGDGSQRDWTESDLRAQSAQIAANAKKTAT